MKYGKLKVTVDYGDGFFSEATYHAYSFVNEGTMVSVLMDVNSVDHASMLYYDIDVMTNPQGIFGDQTNVTFDWVEAPAVTGLYVNHGDNLNDFTEPGVYCRAVASSEENVVSNEPDCMGNSTWVLEVFSAGNNGQIIQRITRCHKTNTAVAQRCFYSGSWGEWTVISQNDSINVPFVSPFVEYNNGTSAGSFRAKKEGHIVHIFGNAAVTSAITLNTTEVTMGTLPEGYRPSENLSALMQGSSVNKWLLSIKPDGRVRASRYGLSSWVPLEPQTENEVGSWLPFSMTFYAD